MIDIKNKEKCCGCSACKSVCPKHCICMERDDEGFLYPIVEKAICINCGLCEQVCPVLHPFNSAVTEPIAYGCKSLDKNLVAKSSSGGLFSIIAESIISKGGVAFGAAFDQDWKVHHISVDNYAEIGPLRESKYVQSDLEECFVEIKSLLSNGRLVLFTGTPCQVAGLNHYLNNHPNKANLITIDIICHSCPSPSIWQQYLNYVKKRNGGKKIKKVSFRDKEHKGWKQYSLKIAVAENNGGSKENQELVVLNQTSQTNLYMQGFLQDLYCRPSCANCPARNYKSGSDITLGDCWAVDKYYDDVDDDTGLSVALLLSKKGLELFESIKDQIFAFQMKYFEVEPTAMHAPLTKNTGMHPNRKLFFKMNKIIPINVRIYICLKPVEILRRLITFSKKTVKTIIGNSNYEYVTRKIRKQ